MKKTRTLFVQFDQHIARHKISAFRGAIVEKVGREHELFHQHAGASKLAYRYPLIQYKTVGGKASVLCLNEGVEAMHNLFGKSDWTINLQGQSLRLSVNSLALNDAECAITQEQKHYTLKNWVGLNAKNYHRYRSASGLKARLEILERTLTGNVLSLAKGLEWHVDKKIAVDIQEIRQVRPVKHKGVELLSFDLDYTSNVALPNYIGLGKSVSHGFGINYRKENK